MEQQRFTQAKVKGGCGCRPRKQGAGDNSLLVVGVYNKEIAYDHYPRMPTRLFFPRVRTPCGHGAQVIIEGREKQSDGGEKDKDNPTTKQPQTTAHRPSLHHLVVFPLC